MDVPEMQEDEEEIRTDSPPGEFKGAELLYQENTLFHRYDVEWRYRIMSRFFLTTAALLLVARWLLEIQRKDLLCLPFFFISLLSMGFFLLDRRVVSQITVSARVSTRLERLLHPEGGHFVGLKQAGRDVPGRHKKKFTVVSYSFVLAFFYLTTTILAGAIVVYCFFQFSVPALSSAGK